MRKSPPSGKHRISLKPPSKPNLTDATKADKLIYVCGRSASAAGDGSRQLISMQLTSKPDRKTDRRRWMRRIAGFAAAILLLAQSVGAAHLHPLPSQQKYATSATVSVDGLCALCLVRFHSPAAFVVTPHPIAPAPTESTAHRTASAEPRFSYLSHLFGRAPPASV
jgi:hypothetical protein